MKIRYKLTIWTLVFASIPFLVVGADLIITFGIGSAFGITYNPITSMAPHILTALCISDAIHIISTYIGFLYKDMEKEKALTLALKINFMIAITK